MRNQQESAHVDESEIVKDFGAEMTVDYWVDREEVGILDNSPTDADTKYPDPTAQIVGGSKSEFFVC